MSCQALRDGGLAAAVAGGELVEFGWRGILGIGERVEVDEDRADDLLPVFAGGDVVAGAAGVVAGGPVVEREVPLMWSMRSSFSGAAADVLVGRVDEVDADVVLGAGPAPGGEFVHDGVVAVFVLDGVLVDAGGEDALLLGVNDDAVAQVAVGDHEHVAVVVDGEPVEGAVHGFEDEAALAFAGGGVGGRVGVLGVGVEAAGAALEGVAGFDVQAAAAARRSGGGTRGLRQARCRD